MTLLRKTYYTTIGSVIILKPLPLALLTFNKNDFRNIPKQKLVLFGVLFPISVSLYTLSLFNTKISLAIFSFYIANLMSSIIAGKLIFGEKLSFTKITGFTVALIAVITLTHPFDTGFIVDLGMVLGYLSGIIATIASVFQKQLTKVMHESSLTFVQVISGILVAGIFVMSVGDRSIMSLSPEGILLSMIFGVIFFLINYLMIYGFKHAEIGTGTLLLSSELVFGPLLAFFVFHETLGIYEIVGGVLVVAATVIVALENPS